MIHAPMLVLVLLAQQVTLEAPPRRPLLATDDARDEPRTAPTADTGLMYHLTWYGADYAAVAGLIVLDTLVLPRLEPGAALYGPRFDNGNPDFTSINNPRYDRALGAPYQKDTIPTWSMAVGGATLALSAGLYDGLRNQSWHRVHNLLLGAAEAAMAAHASTLAIELAVGRLRPDFRDRAARYYCDPANGTRTTTGLDCTAADSAGPYLTYDQLRDGHTSFPSGHAAWGFAVASYLSLYAGGEFVWGRHATGWSRPVGAGLAAGLLGTAAAISATRLTDGRHNLDDVAVGAAIGATAGAVSYFLHFDLQGDAVYRGLSVSPFALGDGVGMQLAYRF